MTTKLDEWNYRKQKGALHKTILRKDIERGVTFLNEASYSKIWGSTKGSAIFCIELRKHINFDLVYRVDFMESRKHHYTVRLFTKDGYTIQLKGFSFGYYGEGSRGSLAVLQECGFTPKQIHKIFTRRPDYTQFKLFRRVV